MRAHSPRWWPLFAGTLLLGCATGRSLPEPVPAAPIDLAPRCDAAPGVLARLPALATAAATRHRLAEVRFETRTLPRDLHLVLLPRPSNGIARLHWILAVDPSADPAHAHLGAHLLGQGATTGGPDGLSSRLLDDGVRLATGRDADQLWIDVTFPEASLQAATAHLATITRPATIPPERLEQARREVKLGLLADEAAPATIAKRLLRRILLPDVAVAAAAPRSDALDRITPRSLRRYLARALSPPGGVLVLAGPRDHDASVQALAAGVIDWGVAETDPLAASEAAPSLEAAANAAPAAKPEAASIYIVDRPGSPQVEILAGLATVPRDHPDFAALEMLASLLGGNVGGRLFRDLRERQGLAYIIDAEQADDGLFFVSTQARHERVSALLQGIDAHLDALVTRPLLPCEVAMLEERMLGELALVADDPGRTLDAMRRALRYEAVPRQPAERAAAYLGLGLEGLEETARRRLAGRATYVLVGDAAWLERNLARALPTHEIVVYDPKRGS